MTELAFIQLLFVLCNGGYSQQRISCHEFYLNCGIRDSQILSKPSFIDKCVVSSKYIVGGIK
jgi:hypothetical protein